MIWIENFPLPPSSNNLLAIVNGRHVKTKEHRDYLDACILWTGRNRITFDRIKKHIHEIRNSSLGHTVFRVDAYVAFEQSRVFTIDWKIKQLDASNRIKALHDSLAKILDIDDREFFTAHCEKVTVTSKDQECTTLRFTPTKPRTLQDIQKLILNEQSIAGSSFLSCGQASL